MKTFGSYKRVFMLGIDGMGCFNRMTDTPNMDRLFKNGATTNASLASRPTISGQCWTSMLTGATPAVHGLSNAEMHPIKELPTIFGIVREAFPDAETAAFTDWSPIAQQIISPTGGASHLDWGEDDELNERILQYLDENDPKLLFIQYDSVDGAGHRYGYGSKGHLDRITHVDGMLGKLIDKYIEKGYYDDTLFIVSADHGGTPGGSHGGWSLGEREVFLGVAGKNVLHGTISAVSLRDYPAIVLWALGVKAPAFKAKGYAAQMPVGVFPDAGIENRQDVFEPTGYQIETKPEPAKGTPQDISNFIDADKILLHLNFEEDEHDASGKCRVFENTGIVKRYNCGVYGQCGEFGAGSLRVEGMAQPGPVFTIATWSKLDNRFQGWMDLVSSKDFDVARRHFVFVSVDTGFELIMKEHDYHQTYKVGMDIKYDESVEETDQWCHFMYTVDLAQRKITGYLNFEKCVEKTFPDSLDDYFKVGKLWIALEQAKDISLRMFDDILIVNEAVDPEQLKKYYGK